MTQERLRELLRERVAEETMTDRSARAWQAARVVRRRRRLGAAAGVVAATLGVSAGIAAVQSTPPDPRREAGTSDGAPTDTTPDTAPDTTHDTTYQRYPVWWSPDQVEEQQLPAVASSLPAEIDLDGLAGADDDMTRALAVFERGRSLVVLGPDGAARTVDLSGLEEVEKDNGYAYFPTPSLAQDGSAVTFAQPDDMVASYDVATRRWGSYTMATAVAGDPPHPGFDSGPAQQYGPQLDGAASYGMGLPIPVRDPGTNLSDPEFMMTAEGILAFTWTIDDGGHSRYKDCCAVAGWLDADTVVYESRQDTSLLVSWRVGTHDFGLVSRIRGAYDAAGYAL